MTRKLIPIACAGVWLAVGPSLKANSYRHLSTVHDGVGSMSTNTVLLGGVAYRHVGAGAQPGGIMTVANAPWVHYAGFLQAVDIKRPLLDTDGDGGLGSGPWFVVTNAFTDASGTVTGRYYSVQTPP